MTELARVQVARELTAAYDRGDIARFAELCDPGVEFVTLEGWIDGGTYRGRQSVVTYLEGFEDAWEAVDPTWRDFEETGEHVIARTTRQLRGRSGGVSTVFDNWVVLTIASGLVTRFRWYPTREEALTAAGTGG